jgi:hypothetical protein
MELTPRSAHWTGLEPAETENGSLAGAVLPWPSGKSVATIKNYAAFSIQAVLASVNAKLEQARFTDPRQTSPPGSR